MTLYNLFLDAVGPRKIDVIKLVRTTANLDLRGAKDAVEQSLPGFPLALGLADVAAQGIADSFRAAGATVQIVGVDSLESIIDGLRREAIVLKASLEAEKAERREAETRLYRAETQLQTAERSSEKFDALRERLEDLQARLDEKTDTLRDVESHNTNLVVALRAQIQATQALSGALRANEYVLDW